jgi:hypothetical protein
MADVFGILFSVLAIMLFLVYVDSKKLWVILLCGFAEGLSLASKYSAILGLVATLMLLVVFSLQRRFTPSELVTGASIFVVSSISLAILLNPFFYPNPVTSALTLAGYMSGGFEFATINPAQSGPITTFFGLVGSLLVPISSNEYPGTFTSIALSVCFVAGFAKLVSLLRSRSNANTTFEVLLVWAGVYVVGLSITDKALFISRYLLPLVPLICLIAAYGLQTLTGGMSKRLLVLIVSLLTLSLLLNVLAFSPEFYQAAWLDPTDSPGSFGTLQLAVSRPLGILSVALSALTCLSCALFWIYGRVVHGSSVDRPIH